MKILGGWIGFAFTIILSMALHAAAAPALQPILQPATSASSNPAITAQANPAQVAQDTQLAVRLVRQHQTQAIEQQLATLHDPTRRLLFDAALIYSQWNQYPNDPDAKQKRTLRYLSDIRRYSAWAGPAVDPDWAFAQVQFLLNNLAAEVVNRIEYWSALPTDRRELKPPAQTARQLLRLIQKHFRGIITHLNNTSDFNPQDRPKYVQALRGLTEAAYDRAFADYFLGLALPAGAKNRSHLFAAAGAALRRWTTAGSTAGVSYPALLLRGKTELQVGRYARAQAFLSQAQAAAAPWGLRYEAGYQQVVVQLRQQQYASAQKALVSFQAWITADKNTATPAARMGAELLAYRLAAAQAQVMPQANQRQKASTAALAILLNIIRQAPQYQTLIFSHLAAALPAKPDLATLPPLKVLAYAWLKAQTEDPAANRVAIQAAGTIADNKLADPAIRAQALLIASVCNGRLGRIPDAVCAGLAFITLAPHDPRATDMLELIFAQLSRLNEAAAVPPAVTKLTRQAIQLAYLHFPDQLDTLRPHLSVRLQEILLRYRIRQYELAGQPQKIFPLVRQYAGGPSRRTVDIVRGLIGQYDRESRKAQATDPTQAQRLASEAAGLLDALIAHLARKPGTHADAIYAWRQLRAAELIRAGQGRQALALYKQLEHQRPPDLRNFIGVARAAFATGDYLYARRLYVKIIPHLETGSDQFWSAYLYLFRSSRKLKKYQPSVRQQLQGLLAIYGSAIGGRRYHRQFQRLLGQYAIHE